MSSIKSLLLLAAAIGCFLPSCTAEAKTSQSAKAEDAPAVEPAWRGIVESGQDLIVITIDTLRADRLPFYAADRPTGGDVEQKWSLAWLAKHGTVLKQTYAPVGKTLPSMTSFWTGLSPLEHGVFDNRGQKTSAQTFAMDLEQAGWAGFCVNASAVLAEGTGLARGYVSYQSISQGKEWKLPNRMLEKVNPSIAANEKVFLWAHYVTPHHPYAPGEEFVGSFTESPLPAGDAKTIFEVELNPGEDYAATIEHLRGLYDEEILTANYYVVRLLTRLDSAYQESGRGGLLDNAVVVITSDHGEELGDHNSFIRHSKSLYSGVIHIPAIVIGKEWPAQHDDRLVALQDLLPWVISGTEPEAPFMVSSLGDRFFALRDARWTLVHNPAGGLSGPGGTPKGSAFPYPTVALFERTQDPLELEDVSTQYPEVTEKLLDALHDWFFDQETASHQDENHIVDDATLSELGYATEEEDAPDQTPAPWTGSQWTDSLKE